MSKRLTAWLSLLVLIASSAPRAAAHDGPEHVIEDLTARIDAGERTARLYVRRADEHRTLRHWRAATADYQRALELSGDNLPALYGFARTHADAGKLERARRAAARGAEAARTPDAAAPFHALAAQAAERARDYEHALASWSRALESSAPEVDWLLGHAAALAALERHEEARDALADAMRRNKSAVLERAWVRSLIRCGDFDAAERHIAEGVAGARWKSSWLVLRARLRSAQRDLVQARRDARRAALEIESRLTPGVPNPVLERQLAEARSLERSPGDG